MAVIGETNVNNNRFLYVLILVNLRMKMVYKIVVCKGSLSAQIGSAILARAINNDYIVKLSDKRKI